MVTGQLALSFAGLLRRLRAGARLTQEELAAAAGVSARSVSNLERGINRTAHKDTAVLLARALGLTGPAAELFVAAARGNVPAAQVLAAAEAAGPRPGAVTGSPYRGLAAFGEQDAGWFFGREAAAAALLDRMSRLLAGGGLLVVSGASGAGKSSLLRAGVLPQIRAKGWPAGSGGVAVCVVHPDPGAAGSAGAAGGLAGGGGRGGGAAGAGGRSGLVRAHRPPSCPGTATSAGRRSQRLGGRAVPSLRRSAGCCWWWTRSRSCAARCGEEGQRWAFISALHAASFQAPAQAGIRPRRHWWCWWCVPSLRPGARTTRSSPAPVQDRYLVTAMTGRQLRMAITEPAKKASSQGR